MMRNENRNQLAAWSVSLSVAGTLAFLAAAFWKMSQALDSGASPIDLVVLTACIVGAITAVVFVVLAVNYQRSNARESALRARYPHLYVVHFVASGNSAAQFRSVKRLLSLQHAKIWPNSEETLGADGETIAVYGGSRTPRLLFAAPSSAVASIVVGRFGVDTRTGSRMTPGLRIMFANTIGESAEIRLVPVSLDSLWQRQLDDISLRKVADSLSAALGLSGDAARRDAGGH